MFSNELRAMKLGVLYIGFIDVRGTEKFVLDGLLESFVMCPDSEVVSIEPTYREASLGNVCENITAGQLRARMKFETLYLIYNHYADFCRKEGEKPLKSPNCFVPG